MSPSTSTTTQAEALRRPASHSRRSSTATPVPAQEARSPKQPILEEPPSDSKIPIHYTVFIRLPFNRNGFEDPPPVEWDAAKDKALWKLISKASNTKELNWEDISVRFNVSLSFLLQQAAWLYERHLEGMKAQMKKLSVASGTPAPQQMEGGAGLAGDVAGGGVGMQRIGSRDRTVPPSIDTQKKAPLPTGNIGSAPGTPLSNRPDVSRTPSTNTLTQSRVFASSPRQPFRTSFDSQRKVALTERNLKSSQLDDSASYEDALEHGAGSETESEEEPSAKARVQASRRPQLNKRPIAGPLSSDGDAEDEEDDSPGGYLPFASTAKASTDDPTATLRTSPRRQNAVPQPVATTKPKAKVPPPDSSASSGSSAQPPPSNGGSNENTNRPGPLSPKYRAELEKLSPRHKKSGSEGSPSIGSSFSDLDDIGVTQSALEEALMSNMQQGSSLGMGSRISTLRDALSRK